MLKLNKERCLLNLDFINNYGSIVCTKILLLLIPKKYVIHIIQKIIHFQFKNIFKNNIYINDKNNEKIY